MNTQTSWRTDAEKAATMIHLSAQSEDADLIAELLERASTLLETVRAKQEVMQKLESASAWRV